MMGAQGDIGAIILAAGRSRRMGRFKPLLPLGGTTVVERVVALYAGAGIKDVCVVTGYNRAALDSVLERRAVRRVANRQWDAGMYASIQAGVRALSVNCRAFFVHPVDIPLVRPETLAVLLRSHESFPEAVCHPLFDGRRGHPVLVPAGLAPALLEWSGQGGLRAFWEGWSGSVREVAVADAGILQDMDTEDDYQRLVQRLKRPDRLSAEECRVLMTQVRKVPPAVWRHCRAVAAVAGVIAGHLQQAGVRLDMDLLECAALVHDIDRMHPDHAAVGATRLENLGYPRVAALVAVHMDLPVAAMPVLDEAAVLFLADKMVVGDRPSNLETRFGHKMAKYGGDPRAAAAIANRRQATEIVLKAVERRIGCPVADIIGGITLHNWPDP